MATATELVYLSALELRGLYRRRELSPLEVAEAVLERIEALNPSLTAFVTVTGELARRHAVEAEGALAQGEDRPLLGIPVSIKDLTVTKGIRTTRGSLLHKDWIPDFDSPVVERVYAAGGVMLGKTNTPELGWKGDSGNRVVGPTHNPWRHGRTAGGSSGGAAAAVAAGLGPLAQGSDGAGSIRIPSAFCGIFGLKPSYGLVPNFPPGSVASLSHVGPMTRTVRDAALFLGAIAGPDARDRDSLNTTGIDYLRSVEGGVSGLRVAWSPDLGHAAVDPEVAALAAAAAGTFAELGCSVEEVAPPIEDPADILMTLWTTAHEAVYDDYEAVRGDLDPGHVELIEQASAYTGADVARAHQRRGQYAEAMRAFFTPYDLLLTPTLPVTAFEAGADRPAGGAGEFLSWTPFTYPFNLTGQPAATVPCGFAADGLPVGLQIVGRWRDDVTVLRAAAAFEEARPWARLRPPV